MPKNVLHKIQSGLARFSKGKKRIASYILENYDKAAFMTANELGSTVAVSESTVVRFAGDLGYSGYPAMQKELQEIVRKELTAVRRIEPQGSAFYDGDLISSVMRTDMERIQSAMEDISHEDFNTAVKELINARHIYILGVRSSSFLAGYLHFYFRMIFEHVTLLTENSSEDILEKLLRIGPSDVMVGISFPRYAQAAVRGMRFARDRGAKVIAVTDSLRSPLCPMACASITARRDMISFVNSPVLPFSLLNALIVSAGYQKKVDVPQIFGNVETIWEEYGVVGNSNDT